MYTAISLFPDQRTYFEALEERLERPVRVLYGASRTVEPGQFLEWTDEQLAACGNPSQADAQERGITFVSFGTVGVRSGFYDARLPVTEQYRDDNGGEFINVYDSMQVDEGTVEALIVQYEDLGRRRRRGNDGELQHQRRVFCEVLERLILCRIAFLGNYEGIEFEPLIDEAVELSLTGDFDSIARDRFESSVTRFQEYIEGTRGNPIDTVRHNIDTTLMSLETHRQTILNLENQLRPWQAQLDAMLRAVEEGGDQRATIVEQFMRLLEDERIDKIEFISNQVILITNHLNLMHPETRQDVYLGKMRWVMDMDGYSIRVTNLTNERGGRAHPHVGTSGAPCFGAMGSSIVENLQRGDFEASIELIFSFFASVNLTDDWGRLARWWFQENPLPPRRYDGTIIEEVTA